MSEPLVLVGFGKHDLKDLWANKKTTEGAQLLIEAITIRQWPPRYRRLSICTKEEVDLFQEYIRWILNTMAPTEEKED